MVSLLSTIASLRENGKPEISYPDFSRASSLQSESSSTISTDSDSDIDEELEDDDASSGSSSLKGPSSGIFSRISFSPRSQRNQSSTEPSKPRKNSEVSTASAKQNSASSARKHFRHRSKSHRKGLLKFLSKKYTDDAYMPGEDDTRGEGVDTEPSVGIHQAGKLKYIRVRSKGKSDKEFGHLFVAQRLFAGDPNAAPDETSDPKEKYSIWALEFSVDGRYMACAGHDKNIYLWKVISDPTERTLSDSQSDSTDETTHRKSARKSTFNAPVFSDRPAAILKGHTSDVLDLCWSKNNFLLSSSMDNTAKLWHPSIPSCLATFPHDDFVTSVAFHPTDDRFFLTGSLDRKLRLWNISGKKVLHYAELSDLITAVTFSPDGLTSVAGCLHGQCLFYRTDGLEYHTEIMVGKGNAPDSGYKITGLTMITSSSESSQSQSVKLLVTTNDSQIRLYDASAQFDSGKQGPLVARYKGLENYSSQIRASFSDDGRYVICGSEDERVYIWDTALPHFHKLRKKENKEYPAYNCYEYFHASRSVVTVARFAKTATRQHVAISGDPIYAPMDPQSFRLEDSENGFVSGMAEIPSADFSHPELPYPSRPSFSNGPIIVTADSRGSITVFREDCSRHIRETKDKMQSYQHNHLQPLSSLKSLHNDRPLSFTFSTNSSTHTLEDHNDNKLKRAFEGLSIKRVFSTNSREVSRSSSRDRASSYVDSASQGSSPTSHKERPKVRTHNLAPHNHGVLDAVSFKSSPVRSPVDHLEVPTSESLFSRNEQGSSTVLSDSESEEFEDSFSFVPVNSKKGGLNGVKDISIVLMPTEAREDDSENEDEMYHDPETT
ncbi:hypothetical protein CANCADRAFT_99913 [Tortispora caseinolytica NRRL Y-17796]|uniref:Uncharacterized protein n=1 Tax=Tortispora caseinolytica NRRL Y-17796 TaxID=767744 RepID=A0A1E4TEB2_9ASCO|nr:hypothetical protein CANCADRAFT_99913 [Tortispora caseinolytica NRRL Y-17796]